MQDIQQLSQEEVQQFVLSKGEAAFRVKQIGEWLWKKNAPDFASMSNLSARLRAELEQSFSLYKLRVAEEQISKDKSRKLSLELADGQRIETVLIPAKGRVTVCISSQAGCPLNCSFCATATMGFVRNLEAYEIYQQVLLSQEIAAQQYQGRLSNIVIMGMGEPLLNFDNVSQAIGLITSSPQGLEMSPSRITLSTVGIPEGIKRLAESGLHVQLAVSLHSADQRIRQELMPIAQTHSLRELSQALVHYHRRTQQRITLEYLLLDGINDRVEDAEKLAVFCRAFPVKINLMEYNPTPFASYGQSSAERLSDFTAHLESKNMLVQVRRSRGKDIAAACGQLVSQKKNLSAHNKNKK
ncbi:MAG: 23S rRNA (adenine(2503)-C(2))-methyltransferase RlmN [Lentimicrobiaceae bacterium]|nr:23S rRNA (adenine(2503)-C(2))-methyltransferase RlmN [Lentimicrobiaceae bacterium]